MSGITCPRCEHTSYNLHDIREGYCGHCHAWTSKTEPVDPETAAHMLVEYLFDGEFDKECKDDASARAD
jgi:hypothetical protein